MVLAQMQVMPGRPDKNLETMKKIIKKAKNDGKSLVIFPELAVSGYLLGDEWENEAFVRDCFDMNEEIVKITKGKIAAIWGNVLLDFNKVNEDGRIRKYNTAFVAQDGKYVSNGVFNGYTIKTLMPNYREFRDKRHFTSLKDLAFERGESINTIKKYFQPFDITINQVKKKVGVIICEDMWDDDYVIKPSEFLKQNSAELILNISASPFGIGKQDKRDRILSKKSQKGEIVYLNNVGIQNNGKNIFVFDGASTIYKNGNKIMQAPSFKDGNFDDKEGINNGINKTEKIFEALTYGLKEFFKTIGNKKVVIGLSGGIDSAVVAALCTIALGKENVIAVNMPSENNSSTTKNLAKNLASNLQIEYLVCPIQESFDYTKKQIEDVLDTKLEGLVLENIQSRDRGSRILAAISAAKNAVFTNNGNKTEIALGYATIYGDICGAICPIGDLYKTQVYELVKFINKKFGDIIPVGIIDLIPSAELSGEQNVDENKGDPFIYEYHDKLLYQFIELRKDPEDILKTFIEGNLEKKLGVNKKIIGNYFKSIEEFINDLEKIYKLFKFNFFKRVQAPPILTVSKRAFGYDLEEAQNEVYFTKKYHEMKKNFYLKNNIL
ncbi:NAD(+) synthase [Candidatus Gracilibacteria bacterium]|nr:NAD(+) synthase [Candidatus Gracilibacteria bacterium]